MTLAVILSICIICSAPTRLLGTASASTQAEGQQPDSAKPPDSSKPPESPPAQEHPSDSKPQASPPAVPAQAAPPSPKTQSDQKPAPSQRKRHGKKAVTPSDCPDPSATSSPAPADPTTSGSAPSSAAPASSGCPPAKKVVRNGGTSEPSIQLVGGASGEQAANKRSTTEQLLGSAEENLKKISGRQLSSSQQDMVNQVHQFMEQSKVAVAAGDVERGHNLAMKAHLLSDELVKPQ